MTKKFDKQVQEHPERFDYSDTPPAASEQYHAEMDKLRPAWAQKMLAGNKKREQE